MGTNNDQEQLSLISIFHYIVGGVLAFFACIPLLHLTLGIVIMSGVLDTPDKADEVPMWFGLIFAVMGGILFFLGQTLAWLTIYSGWLIKRRRRYMFSFIIACLMCLFFPFGTILGIFTIIVLSRESVKQVYAMPDSNQ